MALYHTTGKGIVYGGGDHPRTLAAYRAFVRAAYGSLRGVRFCEAADLRDAYVKLTGSSFVPDAR